MKWLLYLFKSFSITLLKNIYNLFNKKCSICFTSLFFFIHNFKKLDWLCIIAVFNFLYSGGQTIREGLQERSQVLSDLEEKSQALVQFVSSGESARIKARLTQIGRYWEELKESVEHQNGQLEESSSHQTKFNANLRQVRFKILFTANLQVLCCLMTSHSFKRYNQRLKISRRKLTALSPPAYLHPRPTKLYRVTWYDNCMIISRLFAPVQPE